MNDIKEKNTCDAFGHTFESTSCMEHCPNCEKSKFIRSVKPRYMIMNIVLMMIFMIALSALNIRY